MEERRRILEQVEAGEISVEQAVQRLEALADEAGEQEEPQIPPPPPEPIERPLLVRIVWQVTLWVGVTVLVGGSLLVAAVYAWHVADHWLLCGWPLFVLGVLIVVLAWWMQRARWFSLRVRQHDGPNIAFAFPLPLGPIAWLLRVLRPFVPKIRETAVDEMLLAMHREMRDGRPFIVDVDEGEDGEKVQVYFG